MTTNATPGSGVHRVDALVAAKMKLGTPRHQAFREVARENPGLIDAYDAEMAEREGRTGSLRKRHARGTL